MLIERVHCFGHARPRPAQPQVPIRAEAGFGRLSGQIFLWLEAGFGLELALALQSVVESAAAVGPEIR